jgi:Carboxypeptidase regulatory-like domain/TonB-dependent Receptor Plug Domain
MISSFLRSSGFWASRFLALWLGCSTAAVWADGVQTGTVVGRVVDAEAAPLPGVEVVLAGPQTKQKTLTDDNGNFRFARLEIGAYEAEASVLGLRALERDVRVYIDKTTELRLVLREADGETPAAETITRDQIQVTAVAPLIDRFETSVRTSVSREFLEQLPVERFYQSVALLLPGVAGGEDGNPNTSGSLRGSNLFLVDGVDTTDPTTGLFGLNLSYDSVKDVDVTTAAPPVELGRASGAILNVVTEAGSGEFRGSARLVAGNPSWGGHYRGVTGLDREVVAANAAPERLDTTFALALSGPIVAEKLFASGVFEDGNDSFTRPTVTGELWDEDAELQSGGLKLELRLANGLLVLQTTTDEASFGAYAPFDAEPGENRAAQTPAAFRPGTFLLSVPGDTFAIEHRRQSGDFNKLEWSGLLSRDWALTARVAEQTRTLERSPLNSRNNSGAAHIAGTRYVIERDSEGGLELLDEDQTIFNGLTLAGDEERERRQANLAVDAFLQQGKLNHELRFGVDYQNTESFSDLQSIGRAGFDPLTGRAVVGQVFYDVDLRDACIDRLICRPFDIATGAFQPFALFNVWFKPTLGSTQETLALYASDAISFGRFLISAGARFDQVEGDDRQDRALVDDTSLSPRLALKVDATGRGDLLVSAVWSRFVEPFPQSFLDDFGETQLFSGYTEYSWETAGRNCSGLDANDPRNPCWQPVAVIDGFPRQAALPNLGLNRSAVEELVIGLERQLTPVTALRLSLIDRRWRDLWDDIFDIDIQGNSRTAVVNLDLAKRRYRGIHLLLQKRFADRWQMLASYAWSESEGTLFETTGLSTLADFQSVTNVNLINREGPSPYDLTHQLKVFANYRQDLGRSQLALASVLRYETGRPYQRERTATGGVLFETPRGALRLDDTYQVDLSALLEVPVLRQARLSFKLEVFNVTGEQGQLGVESLIDSGRFGLARGLEDLQSPRRARLTVGLHF